MAVAHISFTAGTQHGGLLRSGLSKLEDAITDLVELRGTMALMIDGDGSDAAHFAYMQDKFGFASNAAAKSAWEELNSLLFKLTTNSSVADVSAALTQAFAKFR